MGMRYQDGMRRPHQELRHASHVFMGTTIFLLVLGFVAVLFLAGA